MTVGLLGFGMVLFAPNSIANSLESETNVNLFEPEPSNQELVVSEAEKYLGTPYLENGKTPSGFDSAGFVYYSYENSIQLNIPSTMNELANYGSEVPINELIIGDVVVYGDATTPTAVGIYVGNSEVIRVVANDTVRIVTLSTEMPVTARRIIGEQSVSLPLGDTDTLNVTTETFDFSGWLLDENINLTGTTPFLVFLDEDNLEIARESGVWTSRPDVNAIYPNPTGDAVGVQVTGATPAGLIGTNYKVELRASNDASGDSYLSNIILAKVYEAVPNIDEGNIDSAVVNGSNIEVRGWHVSSLQRSSDYHYLFFLDSTANVELERVNITTSSFQDSPDITAFINDSRIAQASKARFDATVGISAALAGKKVKIVTRYCSDPAGNNGITGSFESPKIFTIS